MDHFSSKACSFRESGSKSSLGATAHWGQLNRSHLRLNFSPSICGFRVARAFAKLGMARCFTSGAGAMGENQGFGEMRISSVFHFLVSLWFLIGPINGTQLRLKFYGSVTILRLRFPHNPNLMPHLLRQCYGLVFRQHRVNSGLNIARKRSRLFCGQIDVSNHYFQHAA